MSTIRKNQPIYRRTKKPAVDLLAQQLERARSAQRARERIAEKDAEAFWAGADSSAGLRSFADFWANTNGARCCG